MSLINLSRINCKSCYKCVNSCSVKAIKMYNEQAEIVNERCIACGHCLVVCPQNARTIENDVQFVKKAMSEGKKVIASIAPSFAGAFDMNKSGQIVEGLKRLGFSAVEETAIGADLVLQLYKKYLNEDENYITTSCSAVNNLIQKYFPSLIKYMAPVVSPMIAHAKFIKEFYGNDSYVVFIGPCIAKRNEAHEYNNDNGKLIDAVITFSELKEWFKEEYIDIKLLKGSNFNRNASRYGYMFPLIGGIGDNFNKKEHDVIKVSGTEKCIELFKNLESGELKGICVEANICLGGCIGGPGMPNDGLSFYYREKCVKDYIREKYDSVNSVNIENIDDNRFIKYFKNKKINYAQPSDKDIQNILKKMGKYEKSDELNCGGCGYDTCREKAIAVFQGMSDPEMCLPFMRSKAENIKNRLFEVSPNVVLIADEHLNIKEFNPMAEKLFHVIAEQVKDKHVSVIMDDIDFKNVLCNKKSIINKKVKLDKYNMIFIENITYLEKQDSLLAVMYDVTHEEKRKEELVRVKQNTFEAAQEVIVKQMRVAQEIASLLGETTAETKIILNKLKKIALEESGESK